jgi:exodeoxyribonuclease-3
MVNPVQNFRPRYVTATWTGGFLVEARVWGPRVLKDGSRGTRQCDHVWKASAVTGGIDFSELPPPVASKLRADSR